MEQELLKLREELKELRRKEKKVRNKIRRIEGKVQVKGNKKNGKNKGNKESSWKEIFEEIEIGNKNENVLNIRIKVPLKEMKD